MNGSGGNVLPCVAVVNRIHLTGIEIRWDGGPMGAPPPVGVGLPATPGKGTVAYGGVLAGAKCSVSDKLCLVFQSLEAHRAIFLPPKFYQIERKVMKNKQNFQPSECFSSLVTARGKCSVKPTGDFRQVAGKGCVSTARHETGSHVRHRSPRMRMASRYPL